MTTAAGVGATVAAATEPPSGRVSDCGVRVSGADDPCLEIRTADEAHAVGGTAGPPTAGPVAAPVLAVLVARDGAAFLPRALAALAAQTRRPDGLIAVDVGSRDATRDLLDAALPVVLSLPRSASFGDAIDAALAVQHAGDLCGRQHPRAPEAVRSDTAAGPPGATPSEATPPAHPDGGWLWLLHDDCAPAPDALERLLAAVETAPSVGMAGCKQIDWDDDQRIVDVGVTVSRSGARVSTVDRHEVDQGQYDERSDVLAVGTAGMLIRRTLWRALGGPDPTLAHARDDLDLGWRAHLAGHRVVVVPTAVVAHATAWATGRRPGAPSWWRAERRDTLQLRLVATAGPLVPVVLVWALLAMWPRAVLQVLLRRPRRALDELLAPVEVWLRPDRLIRSRWRAARGRRVPRRVVSRLYAGPVQLVSRRRDEVAAWIVPANPGAIAADARAVGPGRTDGEAADVVPVLDPMLLVPVEAGPVPDEAEAIGPAVPGVRGRRIRFALSGLLPVLALTGTACVAALHRLIGPNGSVVGPDLLPVPSSAAALWHVATASWRPSGLGGPAVGDPLAAVLAAGSVVLGGVPGRLVDVLVLGALPLAALTAWLAAGALTRSRLVRGWAALVWAVCPPLLAAVSAGRIGAVLSHVLLPVGALLLARATGLQGTRATGLQGTRAGGEPPPDGAAREHRLVAGCGAGLALTGVIAGAPSLAVAAAVTVAGFAVLAVAVAVRGGAPGRRAVVQVLVRTLPVVAVPAGLLAPWWVAVADAPRLLLAEAGVPGSPGAVPRPWWHLLLLPADPATGPGNLAGAMAELARALPATAYLDPATATLAPAVLLAAPLLLLGPLAVLRRAAAAVAAAALVAGAVGLATALAAGRLSVAAGGLGLDAGPRLLGRPGPGVSLFALGLLTAAVALLSRGRHTLRPPRGSRGGRIARFGRGLVATAVALILVAGPVAVLGGWAWQGIAGAGHAASVSAPAVRRVPADVLPALASDEAEGDSGSRTLVLRASRSEIRWTLARVAGPRLGDDSAALGALRLAGRPGAGVPGTGGPGPRETDLVAPVAATLLGDGGEDARDRLAELGVGFVLVVPPVTADVELALDASPGLSRVATVRGAVLWRVELAASVEGAPTRAARARLVDATGRTVQTLPSDVGGVDVAISAGAGRRYVVLTERADRGWRATLDGRPLTPLVTSGWAQCFEVPADAGRLRIEHVGPSSSLAGIQAGVLAFAVLGLLPLPRLRRRLAAPAPPDPSRPVPRAAIAGRSPQELPPMPRVFDADHPEDGEVAPLFSDDPDHAPAPEDAVPEDAVPEDAVPEDTTGEELAGGEEQAEGEAAAEDAAAEDTVEDAAEDTLEMAVPEAAAGRETDS